MIDRKRYVCICAGLLSMLTSGCSQAFIDAGGFFSNLGDGLSSIGTCLSPLAPVDLNAVFAKAPSVEWSAGSAEITDRPQDEVAAFLGEQIGKDIQPADYLALRFYQLGPLASGEIIQIETLSDVMDRVALYDADYAFIPAGSVRDFDGRRRTLQVPIARDTAAAYLRVDLEFLSARNEPIGRLAKAMLAAKLVDQAALDEVGKQLDDQIESAVKAAMAAPLPKPEDTLRDMFVEQP